MKISVDIDCTPQEARTFFGLPDLEPMQQRILAKVEERLDQNLAAMEPEAILKTWLPASVQGFEQLQRMFWNAMSGAAGGGPREGGKGS